MVLFQERCWLLRCASPHEADGLRGGAPVDAALHVELGEGGRLWIGPGQDGFRGGLEKYTRARITCSIVLGEDFAEHHSKVALLLLLNPSLATHIFAAAAAPGLSYGHFNVKTVRAS